MVRALKRDFTPNFNSTFVMLHNCRKTIRGFPPSAFRVVLICLLFAISIFLALIRRQFC